MIKKPFFGFGKPKLDYAGIEGLEQGEVKIIPLPERAVLFVEAPHPTVSDISFQVGDEIKTGQNLKVSPFSKLTFTSNGNGNHYRYFKKDGLPWKNVSFGEH